MPESSPEQLNKAEGKSGEEPNVEDEPTAEEAYEVLVALAKQAREDILKGLEVDTNKPLSQETIKTIYTDALSDKPSRSEVKAVDQEIIWPLIEECGGLEISTGKINPDSPSAINKKLQEYRESAGVSVSINEGKNTEEAIDNDSAVERKDPADALSAETLNNFQNKIENSNAFLITNIPDDEKYYEIVCRSPEVKQTDDGDKIITFYPEYRKRAFKSGEDTFENEMGDKQAINLTHLASYIYAKEGTNKLPRQFGVSHGDIEFVKNASGVSDYGDIGLADKDPERPEALTLKKKQIKQIIEEEIIENDRPKEDVYEDIWGRAKKYEAFETVDGGRYVKDEKGVGDNSEPIQYWYYEDSDGNRRTGEPRLESRMFNDFVKKELDEYKDHLDKESAGGQTEQQETAFDVNEQLQEIIAGRGDYIDKGDIADIIEQASRAGNEPKGIVDGLLQALKSEEVDAVFYNANLDLTYEEGEWQRVRSDDKSSKVEATFHDPASFRQTLENAVRTSKHFVPEDERESDVNEGGRAGKTEEAEAKKDEGGVEDDSESEFTSEPRIINAYRRRVDENTEATLNHIDAVLQQSHDDELYKQRAALLDIFRDNPKRIIQEALGIDGLSEPSEEMERVLNHLRNEIRESNLKDALEAMKAVEADPDEPKESSAAETEAETKEEPREQVESSKEITEGDMVQLTEGGAEYEVQATGYLGGDLYVKLADDRGVPAKEVSLAGKKKEKAESETEVKSSLEQAEDLTSAELVPNSPEINERLRGFLQDSQSIYEEILQEIEAAENADEFKWVEKLQSHGFSRKDAKDAVAGYKSSIKSFSDNMHNNEYFSVQDIGNLRGDLVEAYNAFCAETDFLNKSDNLSKDGFREAFSEIDYILKKAQNTTIGQ